MPQWVVVVAAVTAGVVLAGCLVLWFVGERGRLIQPSTWLLIRMAGWWKFFTPNFWEGYYAGRWTNRYVRMLTDDSPAVLTKVPWLWSASKKWMSDRYHSKVLPYHHAKAIIEVDQDIPLQDLEKIIPYPQARDLVLNAPLEITLFDCACRARRENPCEPTMVCLVIGRPFADFVLEHNPDTARRIDQAEALKILAEEHERGHMHAAWFRRICMGRFYCICNCCSCCCAGIEGMNRLGTQMMTPSGYASQVDAELCQGCGTCASVCHFDARTVVDGKGQRDWDRCMGCGVCASKCPTGATQLVLDEGKGYPLDVTELTGSS